MLNKSKKNIKTKLIASIALMIYAITLTQAAFCQVTPDGRTGTSVTADINDANIFNVTTTTSSGINAFNSFSKFDISSGTTVNLQLGSATNLINLINDTSASNIYGTLNSIKNGIVGGNVYLLNPFGVLIGENGKINVGSLNIFTPTQSDMDKIINSSGEISALYVNKLLNNEIPVTASGIITVRGKINAAKDINLRAGNIDIAGNIQSAAVFQGTNIAFNDVVNANEYNNPNLDIVSENGEIVIKAVNNLEITGKVVTDGANNLNAGNISIESGKNITVKDNAIISANRRGVNSQGGTIFLKAENKNEFSNEEAELIDTKILIQNAVLKGKNVEISSISESKNTAGIDIEELITNKSLTNAGILNYTGTAAYLNANSKAEVLIDTGSQIISDDTISFTANSKSEVNLKNYLPGVTFGKSDAVALTKIASGASLLAQNDIEAKSVTENKLIVDVVPPAAGTNVSVAMTESNTDTQAYIEAGANVSAGNIKIGAFNNSDVRTEVSPLTSLVGLSGITAAVSNVNNITKAYIGSDLNISGNLDINSFSSSKNIVKSKTSGSDHHNALYNNIVGDINNLLTNKLTGTDERDNSITDVLDNLSGSVQLASALAFSETKNDTSSFIGSDSRIKADNININTLNIDVFQVISGSRDGSSGNNGGVFSFGNYANDTKAYIGTGAIVDSKDNLNIKAEAILPYRTDFDLGNPDFNFGWPDLNFHWPNLKLSMPDIDFELPEIDFDPSFDLNLELPDLEPQLSFEADISEGYFSSSANAKKKDAGIAGSVNITTINNLTSAYIDNNAQINTDRTFAESNQNINISSNTKMDKINYTGAGIKSSEDGAAGGSYSGYEYKNKTYAFINDNANVYAVKDVILNAKLEEKIINVTKSGSSAGEYAVTGAIADNHINNTVHSYIKGSSNVDTSGDLSISAFDDLWALNIAGGVVKKTNTGVGVSIANNDITQDIASFIGKKSGEASSGIKGDIRTNNVNLSAASDNGLYSFSLAGATGSGLGTGKFGAGLSGDTSLNNINSKILSYINDDVDVTSTNSIILNSNNLSNILALSGAAATSGANAGIAGSYSDNNLIFNTVASAENAILSAGEDIKLLSDTAGKIKSSSVGAAKATDIGIAGSVAFNNINNNTDSSVQEAVTVLNADNLDVDSSSDLKIYSIAGGVAVAGEVGAGAAYVNNDISNTTKAKIGSSSINAGNVSISSLSKETIESLSAAAGVAKTAGMAGSIALNNINSTTESFIDDNATIISAEDVLVIADNANSGHDIESYAGTLAGGLSVGVGGTIATNKTEKTTKAHINNNATVTAGNDVEIKANSGGDILVKTGNVGVGLVGATVTVSANVIKNTTDAYVEDATVTAGNNGNISIKAIENSKIDSFKVAAAAGKVGVGASGDINVINNQVSSQTGGILQAGGNIQVLADSTETIDSNSHAFSGGLAALAGSISGASIGSGIGDVGNNSIPSKIVTEMANGISTVSGFAGLDTDITGDGRIGQVLAGVANNARLTSTTGDITIKANNTTELNVNAGGYSLGAVAAGGAIAVGSTGNKIYTLIGNNTDLTANLGDVSILALSNDESTIWSYGGSNGLAAIAGSVAQLNSDKTTSVSTGTGTSIKGGNVEIKAHSDNDYDIEAEGDAGGVISVAGSYAISNLNNDTSVTMNSAITSGSTANISSLADNDINQLAQSTAGQTRTILDLVSDLFNGDFLALLNPDNWFTSVLSIGGGVSSVSLDNDSAVNIGNNASIVSADTDLGLGNAGNSSIMMQSISNNFIESGSTTDCSAKAVALGASVSKVDIWTDSLMTIGENALIAGKSIDLTAQNNIDGSSEAITNINPAGADITDLTDKITELLVDNFLWGKLNGVMSISNLESSFRNALNDLNPISVAEDIWNGDGFSSITNRVNNIKNSAQGSLNNFDIYKIASINGDVINYFKNTIMDTLAASSAFVDILPSLYGDATSVSSFDLKHANANININSGAQIFSKNFLNINAENTEITNGIYSGAESLISNNIFGNTNAKNYTNVNSSANINIAENSLLESNNISISSDSDINKTEYVNTSSRGTIFNVASGNLSKTFNLNFFKDAVGDILGSPEIETDSWIEWLNPLTWIEHIVYTAIDIADECGSTLNSVTKTAGINDIFNLLSYNDNAVTSLVLNQNSSAVLNGNINILGASERTLTVNTDGSINPASNLTPTITDKITVENTLNNSQLNIYAPHGTVSGTAKIKDIYYYAPVTIVNNSAKDIVIKDFNMLSKGTSTRNISAQTNSLTFNTLAAETKFGDCKLDISNPHSSIIFTGQVGSPDTNFIINANGNIIGTSATLTAKNIDLVSEIGNINDLNLYLTNHGQVNAQSGGFINIGISGINYMPANFGDYYDEQHINLNNLTAGTSLELNIDGSPARNYTVNPLQGLIIDTETASNGLLSLNNLSAGNDININSTYNTLYVNVLNSTSGNVSMTASHGSINDANGDNNNINANNIDIQTEDGSIALDIDSNGTVSFDSLGLIDVNETSGNLIASLIKSQGDIQILSDGNINAASILGNNIELKSTNGGITATMNSIGKIYAEAENAIDIEEVSGNLNVDFIESKTSNIKLLADNSILDTNNNDTANIMGHDINLIASNADIGELDNYLDIKSTGTISAGAQNNIYLRETNNNMNVDLIEANTGNIGLIAYNSILNARNDDSNNIIGKNITLNALNGSLGDELKLLNIKASGIIKINADGSVYFNNNEGDLNLDEIVSSHGSIGINVTDGNAFIRHISAPNKINIIVSGDTLNIGTIDPAELSLKVSSENGSINIDDGFVSEKATLIADNIKAKLTDSNLTNPLQFTVTGNDGFMADSVDLNIKTSMFESDIFNSNKSTITLTADNINMKWINVGNSMNIDSASRHILVYNDNNYLSDADIQLYSPNKPFWMNAYPGSLVKTNAFIVSYGKNQILNKVDSENSVEKAGFKNTTKIQYDIEGELNPLDMSTMAINQRNNLRWDINTIGTIKLNNTENLDVKITNISSGGAGISMEKDLPIGQELQISLLYNGLDIKAKAKVVRKTFDKETGKYNFGLAFTEIDDYTAKLLPYACMSVDAL